MHDATIQRAGEGGMLGRAHQLGSEDEDDVRFEIGEGLFLVQSFGGIESPKFRGA